jgi:hypothetical protein
MFLGVEYVLDGAPLRVSAHGRDKPLPVKLRGGGFRLVPVGAGDIEPDHSAGHFHSWPADTMVTLDMLRNPTGLWQRWRAATHAVKIPVARFYDDDALGYARAHDLKPGQFLQGALLRKASVERVYFVIVPQPGSALDMDRWWPRIIGVP